MPWEADRGGVGFATGGITDRCGSRWAGASQARRQASPSGGTGLIACHENALPHAPPVTGAGTTRKMSRPQATHHFQQLVPRLLKVQGRHDGEVDGPAQVDQVCFGHVVDGPAHAGSRGRRARERRRLLVVLVVLVPAVAAVRLAARLALALAQDLALDGLVLGLVLLKLGVLLEHVQRHLCARGAGGAVARPSCRATSLFPAPTPACTRVPWRRRHRTDRATQAGNRRNSPHRDSAAGTCAGVKRSGPFPILSPTRPCIAHPLPWSPACLPARPRA